MPKITFNYCIKIAKINFLVISLFILHGYVVSIFAFYACITEFFQQNNPVKKTSKTKKAQMPHFVIASENFYQGQENLLEFCHMSSAS